MKKRVARIAVVSGLGVGLVCCGTERRTPTCRRHSKLGWRRCLRANPSRRLVARPIRAHLMSHRYCLAIWGRRRRIPGRHPPMTVPLRAVRRPTLAAATPPSSQSVSGESSMPAPSAPEGSTSGPISGAASEPTPSTGSSGSAELPSNTGPDGSGTPSSSTEQGALPAAVDGGRDAPAPNSGSSGQPADQSPRPPVMTHLRPDMANLQADLPAAARAIVHRGTDSRRPRNHNGGGRCLTTPSQRAKGSCSRATHHPRRRSTTRAKR
jgi:hypothetical protein